MPRCLHPSGSRRQAVCRGGVHFTRNEFLAHAVPDSGRKTPAPDLSQKGLCVRQSATLVLLVRAFLPIHISFCASFSVERIFPGLSGRARVSPSLVFCFEPCARRALGWRSQRVFSLEASR